MPKPQKVETINVRIRKQTHEKLKLKCDEKGWLLGVYIDKILSEAILEKPEEMERRISSSS